MFKVKGKENSKKYRQNTNFKMIKNKKQLLCGFSLKNQASYPFESRKIVYLI